MRRLSTILCLMLLWVAVGCEDKVRAEDPKPEVTEPDQGNDLAENDLVPDSTEPPGETLFTFTNPFKSPVYLDVTFGSPFFCHLDSQSGPSCHLFMPFCMTSCPDDPEEDFPCALCAPPRPAAQVVASGGTYTQLWPHQLYATRAVQGCDCYDIDVNIDQPLHVYLRIYTSITCYDDANPGAPPSFEHCGDADESGRIFQAELHGERLLWQEMEPGKLPAELTFSAE